MKLSPKIVAATLGLLLAAATGLTAATANSNPIDGYQGKDLARGCNPVAKPGVLDFRALILARQPATVPLQNERVMGNGISRACNARSGNSEHKEGRAWDWMLNPNDKSQAGEVMHWLLSTDEEGNKYAIARRMGLMYIIWDHKIILLYNEAEANRGWRPYTGADPHTSHAHFSFSRRGANGETSFWKGRGYSASQAVAASQQAISIRYVNVATNKAGTGYILARNDGKVATGGAMANHGGLVLNDKRTAIVASTISPSGNGYRLAGADGAVYAYGDSSYQGGANTYVLSKPIVGMTNTPTGNGYWLVAADGGIFAYGDAGFFGAANGFALQKPIVGIASTPSGNGYWLVASDGGIFAFGDAPFHGSAGGVALQKPIVGMASTPSGDGYWLVASDGGVFAYGAAPFHGSAAGFALQEPVSSISAGATGYYLAAGDGGTFAFGAPYLGPARQ